MQNTDVKTRKSHKKLITAIIFVLLISISLLISFGKPIGVPDWNDIFAFCGISADMNSEISISFIDVGSADACYVRCGNKHILIDTGQSLTYDRLWAYIKRSGCTHFDAIIISHPESDHMGAAADVIRDFGTDVLYMPSVSAELEPQNAEYERFNNSLKEYSVNVINPQIPSSTMVGELSIEFISPQKDFGSLNGNSLVVRITYKGKVFLFTGDMVKATEGFLLNCGTELKCDVLKVAHHGSKTSSSEEFLRAASPEIAVVSVADDDVYLPDYYTMALINSCCDELYVTATDRTVVITSDGSSLSVKTHA